MPRKRTWKKAAAKKSSFKADVGDKYPTDVVHVQLIQIRIFLRTILRLRCKFYLRTILWLWCKFYLRTILRLRRKFYLRTILIFQHKMFLKISLKKCPMKCNILLCSVHVCIIVLGSFLQGNTKFLSFSTGNQCSCNSLIMLVNSYNFFFIQQWIFRSDFG